MAVKIRACVLAIWAKVRGLRGINHEQKDTVQHLFENNGWPWNVKVTDMCETCKHSTARVTR